MITCQCCHGAYCYEHDWLPAVLARFRQVLSVIGWAAAHCAGCRRTRATCDADGLSPFRLDACTARIVADFEWDLSQRLFEALRSTPWNTPRDDVTRKGGQGWIWEAKRETVEAWGLSSASAARGSSTTCRAWSAPSSTRSTCGPWRATGR